MVKPSEALEVVVDGEPARVVFDLMAAPRPEFAAYLAGRVDGYLDGEDVGYARGYAACDAELAAIQRAAHRVVRAMARLDPWEDAQRRRRQRQVEASERHAEAARPWLAEVSS